LKKKIFGGVFFLVTVFSGGQFTNSTEIND